MSHTTTSVTADMASSTLATAKPEIYSVTAETSLTTKSVTADMASSTLATAKPEIYLVTAKNSLTTKSVTVDMASSMLVTTKPSPKIAIKITGTIANNYRRFSHTIITND
jgi:hypothetical protein